MKLIMEQWRRYLKEGITDVVYHYTSGLKKAANILKQNRFLASGAYTKGEVETQYGNSKLYYFSTARTPVNAYTGDYPSGAIFKLDGRALGEVYQAKPIDYYGSGEAGHSSKKAANPGEYGTEGFEAEDRIITDEPYIEDADRYIEEIHFAIPLYRWSQDFMEDKPTRKPGSAVEAYQMKGLKEGIAVAEQRNIPFYIHIDKTTWPHVEVGKKKALTSLSQFMEELEKSGVTVREAPDMSGVPKKPGRRTREDEVFRYYVVAKSILAGDKELDTSEIEGDASYTSEERRKKSAQFVFKEITTGPAIGPKGRRYPQIDNALHSIGREADARDTLELLSNLMRQTKQSTVKDFEDYLRKVYEENHGEQ
jgi:hypothetical protein